ncbi:MAG: hypothetical protein ACX93O_11450 [Flagellimonas sp.]
MRKSKIEECLISVENRKSVAVLFLFSILGLLCFNCSPKYSNLSSPMDEFQKFTAKGNPIYKSIHEAGLRRFRPIILETSSQAFYLIPMAI